MDSLSDFGQNVIIKPSLGPFIQGYIIAADTKDKNKTNTVVLGNCTIIIIARPIDKEDHFEINIVNTDQISNYKIDKDSSETKRIFIFTFSP